MFIGAPIANDMVLDAGCGGIRRGGGIGVFGWRGGGIGRGGDECRGFVFICVS